MTYPSKKKSLGKILAHADSYAEQTKAKADAFIVQASKGPVPGIKIKHLAVSLRDARANFKKIVTVSGLTDYAKVEMNDPALDLVAEITDIIAVIETVLLRLRADFTGQMLEDSQQTDGSFLSPQFSVANTANLRADLAALSALID